jgi:peptidyl-prolyl cis-trans isomerase C
VKEKAHHSSGFRVGRFITLSPLSYLFIILFLIGGGANCRRPPALPSHPKELVLRPQVRHPDEVVAHVNGIPILKQDLKLQIRSGRPNEQALEPLIQQELLVQEATRRGLSRGPQWRRLQHRIMAHLLIRKEFKDKFTSEDIPQEMIKKAYQMNQIRFVHPEMVHVAHIVVIATEKHPDEYRRRALALAKKIRATVTAKPLSLEEFKQLTPQLQQQNPNFTIKLEELPHVPPEGYVVKEYSAAAFKLQKAGDISPITHTRYGYHVIYFVKRIAAKNISLSEAEPEIRQRIFDEARAQAFLRWAEQLEKNYAVTFNEALSVEALSQIGDRGGE